jgi:hypothetical protein
VSAVEELLTECEEAKKLNARKDHGNKVRAGLEKAKSAQSEDELMTFTAAAAFLGITCGVLGGACTRGTGPKWERGAQLARNGKSSRLVWRSELLAWWAARGASNPKDSPGRRPVLKDPIQQIQNLLEEYRQQIARLTSENDRLKSKLSAVRKIAE